MKLRLSLRVQLVLLMLAAVVPLLAGSIHRALHDADAAITEASADLMAAASFAVLHHENSIRSANQLLAGLAAGPDLEVGGLQACQDYFVGLKAQFPVYANIGIGHADGSLGCDALRSPAGFSLFKTRLYADFLAKPGFSVGGYSRGQLSGREVLSFGYSEKNERQETAVFFATLDIEALAASYTNVLLPPHAQLLVLDRHGTILLAQPPLPGLTGQMLSPGPMLSAARDMQKGVVEADNGRGEKVVHAFLPAMREAKEPLLIAVSIARDEVTGPIQLELRLQVAFLALIALLGGWVAWLIGGRTIVAPTMRILHATHQLRRGNLDVRVALGNSPKELDRIAGGFNLMADSLQQRERDLEKELAHSRQAYSTLELTINSMQEGLMAVDASGKLLLINETAAHLFATESSPAILSSSWPRFQGLFNAETGALVPAADLPLHRALHGESGGPQVVLVRNDRAPAGRLLSCTYRPMLGGGTILGALMVFADITEVDGMRRAQEKSFSDLRDVQRRLLDAQRIGRIGAWELDIESGQLWLSDEVFEVFGIQPADFSGTPDSFADVIHPDDLARYNDCRLEVIDDELDIEYRIITPTGDIRWVNLRGQGYTGAGGKRYRGGVVQEITSRKEAELNFSRITELLNRTGQIARVGGWEMAVDSLAPYWSEEIFRIYEVDPEEGLNVARVMSFLPPEAQAPARDLLRIALEDGTPWDVELPVVTAKGRHIWVRSQGQALMEDGRVVRLIGVVQDLTERHAADEHLRLLETSIARLNEMVLITEAEPADEPGPRIIYVNQAFERCTGYLRDEVMGRSPRFLQGPATSRKELDRIGAAIRAQENVRAELLNYRKNGEAFWIEMDIMPIKDAAGRATHMVAIERDVTLRKQAEQALMDSEQRYLALFEAAPLPMWLFDVKSLQFLLVNDAATRAYGYSRQEFLSMSVLDIRNDFEKSRLLNLIRANFPNERVQMQHRRSDGSEFLVEVVSSPIPYIGREARFVVVLDITARLKAEKEVQEQLFTLQRATDAAQAITWHQVLEGTMQETAEQARGVIGAHQAMVSLTFDGHWDQTVNALSLSERYAGHRQRILSDEPQRLGMNAMIMETSRPMRMTQEELAKHPRWHGLGAAAGARADGGSPAPEGEGTDSEDPVIFNVDFDEDMDGDALEHFEGGPPLMRGWLAIPLTARNGKTIGVLQLTDKYEGEFTLQDEYVALELAQLASIAIENARLFEEVHQLNVNLEQKVIDRTVALGRQEALFRTLAEQAPQVIWTLNNEGEVTYFNHAWYELVGGGPGDWLGTQWLDVLHPDDRPNVIAQWHEAREKGETYEGLRRALASDGRYRTMSYRGSPVLNEAGEIAFWVGIDADVTEIKGIEAALRLSNQELEAFSYSVSHDLRSPLNTIDGFSRLLAKQLSGDAAPKLQHYLSRIQAGVAQMGRLIEDLLGLAQVARVQLHPEAVDLTHMAREILDEWRTRQPEREVVTHVEPDMTAHGDTPLLRVVMENLLANAWKFTAQTEGAKIDVSCYKTPAGEVVFYVRDNGAGFDMAYADKLFTAFQRLHSVSEFPGTGIGLATVGRVVARHGGRVWTEAKPGEGATFFFTLPATPVEAPTVSG
ncbi:MAG: PAS domain S-box protein [Comamonadaceae bacterium]|nr:MAG: PAS domain S-box protein [Comamonadaceae bacterium]